MTPKEIAVIVNGESVDVDWAVAKCAYHGVPEYMAEGLYLYLAYRIAPGDFMTALLSNDFMGAVGRADALNFACLRQWAQLIYCELPSNSHGSPERVRTWLKGEEDAHGR